MKYYTRNKELPRIKHNIDSLNKNIEYIVLQCGIFNPHTGKQVYSPKYIGDMPKKFLDDYKYIEVKW